MHASTEASMKSMAFNYSVRNCGADQFCGGLRPSKGGGSMCTSGSENLDYDAKTSCYIALRELSKFPEYKDRQLGVPPPPAPVGPQHLRKCNGCCKAGCGLKCCSEPTEPQKCCCLARVKQPDKCPLAPPPPELMTVSEAVAEWDAFFYNKLRDQALSGLFSENGSPNYWYRTWPAIFNLADLGSPRVRQRAKMFIDLAFIEGESLQVAGFRGGAKMRAKKDGGVYPVYSAQSNASGATSPIVVYQAGMGRCAGDAMKPVLLGEGGPPVWRYTDGESHDSLATWWPHFASAVIEMQTTSYNMSSTVIMLRNRTATQKLAATEITVQNRMLGEANHTGDGLSLNSSIVHNFYATASFGLGSIYFLPGKENSTIGAPPQESMVGLTFANEFHSTIGIPHSSGPKWSVQEGGAMVSAQCSGDLGCMSRYEGDFSVEIYNVTAVHIVGAWTFVEPANGLQAWAAVRYAWSGVNTSASALAHGVSGSGNASFLIVPEDPWSPLVLFAGNSSTFGSLDGFIQAVTQAKLDVSEPAADGSKVITFVPPAGKKPCQKLCKAITFPWSLNKTHLTPPSIGGTPLEDQPAMAYNGPFMTSVLGTDIVRTNSGPGGIGEEFSFSTNTIKRLH